MKKKVNLDFINLCKEAMKELTGLETVDEVLNNQNSKLNKLVRQGAFNNYRREDLERLKKILLEKEKIKNEN